MSFYSEFADIANELLAEFGQAVVVTNFEMAVENTATGVASQTSNQYSTVGVLLDFDYRNFGEGSESYRAVSSSDKRLLLNASAVINPLDLVLVNNVLYKVHVAKLVNPAGTRVLYDLWIQK